MLIQAEIFCMRQFVDEYSSVKQAVSHLNILNQLDSELPDMKLGKGVIPCIECSGRGLMNCCPNCSGTGKKIMTPKNSMELSKNGKLYLIYK